MLDNIISRSFNYITGNFKIFHLEQFTQTNTKCSTWNNSYRRTKNVPRGTIYTDEQKMFHVEQFIQTDAKCSTWNNSYRPRKMFHVEQFTQTDTECSTWNNPQEVMLLKNRTYNGYHSTEAQCNKHLM